jgi:hypothetical protein
LFDRNAQDERLDWACAGFAKPELDAPDFHADGPSAILTET